MRLKELLWFISKSKNKKSLISYELWLGFGWTFKIKATKPYLNIIFWKKEISLSGLCISNSCTPNFTCLQIADYRGCFCTCCINMFLDQMVANENRSDLCILWCVTSNFFMPLRCSQFLHFNTSYQYFIRAIVCLIQQTAAVFSLQTDHEWEKGTNQD